MRSTSEIDAPPGRSHEWRRLTAAARAAGRRGPVVVVVAGPPGMGTSTLLDRLAAALVNGGWDVGRGDGRGHGGGAAVLIEALQDLHAGSVDEPFTEAADDHRAWSAPSVGELVRRLVEPRSGADGPVRERRALVLDAVAEDDVLAQVLSQARDHPPTRVSTLVVVGALHEHAFPEHDRIILLPIGDPEVLMAAVPGSDRATAELAGGNPGVLAAMTKASGASEYGGVDDLSPADRWTGARPPVVGDQHTFAGCTGEAVAVAQAAAVLGLDFDPATVARIAGVSSSAAFHALDELARAGLVTATATGMPRFRNPLLRAEAYHSADVSWRHAAHRRTAWELVTAGGPAATVAAHLQQAGALDEAGRLLLLDAAHTELFTSPRLVTGWLGAARRSAPTRSTATGSLLLAIAAALTDDLATAVRAIDETWSRLDSLEAPARTAAFEWRARILTALGRRADARRVVAEGLRTAPCPLDRANLLLDAVLLDLADGRNVQPLVTELAARHTNHPDGLVRAHVDALLATVMPEPGPVATRARYATEAAALLEGLADRAVLRRPEALLQLAAAEERLGRCEQADHHRARAARLFATQGRRTPGAVALPPASPTPACDGMAGRTATAVAPVLDRSGTSVPAVTGQLRALSPREHEIAVLVADGLTNQQLASRLQLSTKTVETHLGRVFRKLGVGSRAQVASLVGRSAASDERTPVAS